MRGRCTHDGGSRGERLPVALVEHLLDRWPVAVLGTIGADGAPALVPVVFARSGGLLWSAIDGKPKGRAELARLRNVRRDPRVSLLLDGYDSDWTQLWWLRIDATARVLRAGAQDSPPALEEAVGALRSKYPQYATTPVFRGEEGTLLRLEPGRVRSWCASPAAVARLRAET